MIQFYVHCLLNSFITCSQIDSIKLFDITGWVLIPMRDLILYRKLIITLSTARRHRAVINLLYKIGSLIGINSGIIPS